MRCKNIGVFLITHEQAELCSGGLISGKVLSKTRWLDEITDSLDERNEVDLIFLDFRKTFYVNPWYCRPKGFRRRETGHWKQSKKPP